jgi:hypothetical protein
LVESIDFCDSVKVKRVGKEGALVQITFWQNGVQLPYSSLFELESIVRMTQDDLMTTFLSAKVRPFSEEFKARRVKPGLPRP